MIIITLYRTTVEAAILYTLRRYLCVSLKMTRPVDHRPYAETSCDIRLTNTSPVLIKIVIHIISYAPCTYRVQDIMCTSGVLYVGR